MKGQISKPCAAAPGDDPAIQAWVRLAHAYHNFARRIEIAFDVHSLSLAQFEVLARLTNDSGITQNELARKLLVTKGNVCGLLDRMATADLVQRQPDPDDRRANRLSLTKAGQNLFATTLPVYLGIVKEIMAALSTEELNAVQSALEKLIPEQPA